MLSVLLPEQHRNQRTPFALHQPPCIMKVKSDLVTIEQSLSTLTRECGQNFMCTPHIMILPALPSFKSYIDAPLRPHCWESKQPSYCLPSVSMPTHRQSFFEYQTVWEFFFVVSLVCCVCVCVLHGGWSYHQWNSPPTHFIVSSTRDLVAECFNVKSAFL